MQTAGITLEDWWDPKGRFSSLHKLNPLRMDYILQRAGSLKGLRILDVGCGGGLLSEAMAKEGAQVTAIDLSPVFVDIAKEHARKSGIEIDYRCCPVAQVEGQPPFDVIVCAEVLEHVDDVPGFIRESISLLKPGGLYFFETINRNMIAGFLAIFVAENVLRMVPQGTHELKRFLKPQEVADMLAVEKVRVEDIKGFRFDPLKWNFEPTTSTLINYVGVGRKENAAAKKGG
ncbi:MAG: bifunctional 2-polyprenyl-6-hydroxyphenol methylase/3-demethylubiquinol 3-O-methyltransferase UbiG [Nitrospirota bacterium]|nr:bifunctional 2-polyprenyl-6-hydroxyphenol methylase/3-demethylubiquinol 3-O-methyltransferase UbiG [Nitrospirota bacterium]